MFSDQQQSPQLTPEQARAFGAAYGLLCLEHGVRLVAVPSLRQSADTGTWSIQVTLQPIPLEANVAAAMQAEQAMLRERTPLTIVNTNGAED